MIIAFSYCWSKIRKSNRYITDQLDLYDFIFQFFPDNRGLQARFDRLVIHILDKCIALLCIALQTATIGFLGKTTAIGVIVF